MKLNKKLLLKSTVVPLAISMPVVIAVSCGTSIANTSTKTPTIATPKKLHAKKSYAIQPMMQLNSYFTKFIDKFDTSKSPSLKVQALKTKDAAIIAFLGYIESDGTLKGASPDNVKKAKKEFSEKIIILKTELDKLFTMAIGNPDSATNLISPLLKRFIKMGDANKESKIQRLGKVVIENVLNKVKMVMDNVIDTLINIESSQTPDFMKDKTTKKELKPIGTLEDLKTAPKGVLNGVEYNKIEGAFKNNVSQMATNIHISDEGTYDIKDHIGGIIGAAAGLLGGFFGNTKFKIEKDEIKDTAWQIGIKNLIETSKKHPEKISIYKNKEGKIFFKLKETTTHLANEIKSKLKFNEEHVSSLLDDNFLNKHLLIKSARANTLKLPTSIKEIFSIINKDRPSVDSLLNKVQLVLEEFGKTLQLTEVNLQMIVSHLVGDKAVYYGGLDSNYKPMRNTFTTPQFNIYNYANYKGYNKQVNSSVIKNGLKLIIKKHIIIIGDVQVDVNLLDILKNITRDPHSNYTVGLFQIAQVLTEGLKKEGMKDLVIKI